MTLIQAYKNRGLTQDLTILDSADATITPGANDKVRVIIGRTHESPLFSVTSDAATANGSTLTKGATNRLRLDSADLEAIDPGVYSLFFDFFDNADGAEWKTIENEVFALQESPN